MDEDRGFRSFQVLFFALILLSGSIFLVEAHELHLQSLPFMEPMADIEKVGNWSVTGTETYTDSVIDLDGNLPLPEPLSSIILS
jgi:hypothetical protein